MEQEASQLTTLSKSNEAVTGHKTVSFIGESVSKHTMTISGDVLQMIIQQLTDLYSDPISASIRETVSNAIDATILARNAGVDAPNVDIQAPSSFSPTFIVEDHGVGMTGDQIYANFADYGNSTKINDMDATGSKGLGAKAPLAYTTTCVVSTVRDGHKIVLTLNRGEHVNEAETIFDGSTDEPNGTRVEIPVRPEDVGRFNDVISQYIRYATPDIPLSIDGSPAASDFDKTWTHLIDIPVAVDDDGDPINGKLYVNSGSIGDTFSRWVSESTSRRYSPGTSFVEQFVSVSLMGWKYDLDSIGKDSRFLLEITPGVVDFPPSRDEIKRNDRFKSLIASINRGLDIPSSNSKAGHPLDEKSISSIWGSVPVSDRSNILKKIVSFDDENVASILDKMYEIWPDEVAVYDNDKTVESFDEVFDLVVTPYYHSKTRPAITSMIGYGVSLSSNGKDGNDHNYVRYEFADGSVSSVNSVLNDDMGYEKSLHDRWRSFDLSKISSEARNRTGSYLTSGVLRIPVEWMKFAFNHMPRGHWTPTIHVMIITGSFDGSKSFGRLRNWVRENYGNNDDSCQVYCCIAKGSYPDGHFDGFRDASIDAGVKWIGVVDADDLIVKRSRAKKTSTPAVKTPVHALVESGRNLSVEQRAMNLVMKNDLTLVEEVTFKDLVNDGSIVFFSYDDSIGSMLGILRIMTDDPDTFNGQDIVIISDNAKIRASDLEPLNGYDKIFISAWVTGRIKYFKSMKTAHTVPTESWTGTGFRNEVLCHHPDTWGDTLVSLLSDPRIFSYGSSYVVSEIVSIEDDLDYEDESNNYASVMRGFFTIDSTSDDILGIADAIWKNTENKAIRGAVRTALYHWELAKIVDGIDYTNSDLVFLLRIFNHQLSRSSPRNVVRSGGSSLILTTALSWFKQYEDMAWDEVDKLGYRVE